MDAPGSHSETTMRESYRYMECGLDNVVIEGIDIVIDDAGEQVYCIENVTSLHKIIAHALITQEQSVSGKELRFLRTEMGLTQEQLAQILNVARGTINRWETQRDRINPTAEFLVRMLVAEKLDLDPRMSVEEMAGRCIWKAERVPIRIEGSDPERYRLAA